jgi:hypothetical protein
MNDLRGRLPGIEPGDWFSVSCDFAPPEIAQAHGCAVGTRTVICEDACLRREGFLLWEVLNHEIEPLRFAELLPFLNNVVVEVGVPRRGWVISHSCWQSSVELAVDDVNWVHGEMMERLGVAFGPMAAVERAALVQWAVASGWRVLFNADDLNEV